MRLAFRCGVADYPREGVDLHDLRAADGTMYRAKAGGHARVMVADASSLAGW